MFSSLTSSSCNIRPSSYQGYTFDVYIVRPGANDASKTIATIILAFVVLPSDAFGFVAPAINGKTITYDKVLGQGASSNVLVTKPIATAEGEQLLAVKLLRRVVDNPVSSVDDFVLEQEILKSLAHLGRFPTFVGALDNSDGQGFAMIPVVKAFDPSHAKETTGLCKKNIATIVDDVRALHKMEKPVCHGDLRPSNILKRADGSAIIVDFGCAVADSPAFDLSSFRGAVYHLPSDVHDQGVTHSRYAIDLRILVRSSFLVATVTNGRQGTDTMSHAEFRDEFISVVAGIDHTTTANVDGDAEVARKFWVKVESSHLWTAMKVHKSTHTWKDADDAAAACQYDDLGKILASIM